MKAEGTFHTRSNFLITSLLYGGENAKRFPSEGVCAF